MTGMEGFALGLFIGLLIGSAMIVLYELGSALSGEEVKDGTCDSS